MLKIIFLFISCTFIYAQSYSDFFTANTMRIDYYHSGTKDQEHFSIDQIYDAGPWAGSKNNLVTNLNLGEYQVRIYDAASSVLIYSRGYSSVFNEWQTTSDAKENWKALHESWLIPMPKKAIQLAVVRRDKKMSFREVYSTIIDPSKPTTVNKALNKPDYKVTALMKNGDPSKKVDIVIVGDGYSKDDMEQFRKDAKYYNDAMFNTSPFKERKNDFNVWLVEVVSPESGISKPDKGIWKNNALGCQYNTFGSARYILTEDNKALRDAAGLAPYDYINILINDNRYGGGGIYNLYTTTFMRVDNGPAWQLEYVYVHEFGHSFAGLGDEYYSSSTGYDDFYSAGVEPWEPNVTALLDPENIKWKEFVTKGTPLPTPWDKEKYDSIAAERFKLDRLADDYYKKWEPFRMQLDEIMKTGKNHDRVGAFEGAGYLSHGLYRPALDCRMFSLSLVDFDPVCSATIEKVIDYLTK